LIRTKDSIREPVAGHGHPNNDPFAYMAFSPKRSILDMSIARRQRRYIEAFVFASAVYAYVLQYPIIQSNTSIKKFATLLLLELPNDNNNNSLTNIKRVWTFQVCFLQKIRKQVQKHTTAGIR
jgi:hypothetical protein